MLNYSLLNNKDIIREQLRKQPFVVIPNALLTDVADALHAELVAFEGWNYQDEKNMPEEQIAYQKIHAPGYTFSRHNIMFGTHTLPPLTQSLYDYLVSEPIRQWMSDVSNRRCDDFEGGAAMLNSGGHIADHNDYGIYKMADGSTATRTLTFNYYLTRNWQPDWGGNFIWKNPNIKIVPSFNTLVMFLVGRNSEHSVESVKPETQEPRLAITGWFRTIRRKSQAGNLNLKEVNK